MRNIWTIARREYKLNFISPIAYVVAFLILITLGVLFTLNVWFFTQNAFSAPGSAPDATIITGPFVFLLVLSAPALTMRLLADEQRMGTMELLLTAPLRDWEIVVGKWLGAFLFLLTIILVSLIFPILLNGMVSPGIDQGLMVAAYLGVILVSAAFLGIGVGISALFSNQLTAFFATLAVIVVLWWLIGFPADVVHTGADFFRYLSMNEHFYNSLNTGVINLSDLVYYLSLTALGLFVGTSAVEMRRWR
jgi:ABC-2 type transport system permease protein